MKYVESPRFGLYLQGEETGDKSIQKTLNLTLKVVHNSPEKPLIHRLTASYPQFQADGVLRGRFPPIAIKYLRMAKTREFPDVSV